MVRWVLALALLAIALPAWAKKVVFIAGVKSHGPGEHEYELGARLFAKCIETSPDLGGWRAEVHTNGWPENPATLDDADSIVVYCDGPDHKEADDPLLTGDRLAVLGRQMRRGCGLVLLHYATFAPVKRGGPELIDWVGGFFDYETGTAPNQWYSKIQVVDARPELASPRQPILRGVAPFALKDEFYYNMKMREDDRRRVPILNIAVPGEVAPQTVAWAVQRAGGGRGFAFTGGHSHANWRNDELRKLILNAIVWTAHGAVPKMGVRSEVAADG